METTLFFYNGQYAYPVYFKVILNDDDSIYAHSHFGGVDHYRDMDRFFLMQEIGNGARVVEVSEMVYLEKCLEYHEAEAEWVKNQLAKLPVRELETA